jgi:lysophospholipase L1-like esterase
MKKIFLLCLIVGCLVSTAAAQYFDPILGRVTAPDKNPTFESVTIDGANLNADTLAALMLNRGKHVIYEESFASVSDWTVTGDVTASGGVVTFADADGTALVLERALTLTPYRFPVDRPFVIEMAITVAAGQKLSVQLKSGVTVIAYAIVGDPAANRIALDTHLVADSSVIPTNFNMATRFKLLFLIDPTAGRIRFYLYWQDSVTATTARMEEIGGATTWSYTAASTPTTLLFTTSAAATGTATLTGLKVYVPWGVIIGDSIATGHPNFSPAPAFYATQVPSSSIGYWLKEASGGYTPLVNQGMGGHSTDHVVARAPTMVSPFKPDWAFVYIGTNDCGGSVAIATAQANLATAVDAILAADSDVKVMLWEIAPRDEFDATKNAWKDTWNAWLQSAFVPTRPRVYLTKSHDALENPSTADALWTPYSADGTHMTVAGYRKIADAAWAVLSGQTSRY